MFKYSRNRDRFVPDRTREPYSFRSTDRDYALDHRCVCPLPCDTDQPDFLEPFECERQDEQQYRAYRQLEAYMSPEINGGFLLPPLLTAVNDENGYKQRIAAAASDDAAWPVRMIRQRRLARKSNVASTAYAADLLLDMPNLSDCWRSKILDWSSTGYLTAAIESSVHLWSGRTQSVRYTVNAVADDGEPIDAAVTTFTDIICLKWDACGQRLAYSFTVEKETAVCTCTENATAVHNRSRVTVGTTGRSSSRTTVSDTDDGETTDSRSPAGRTSFGRMEVSTDTLTTDTMCGYVKVWLLNGEKDGSNCEQKTSSCSCSPVGHRSWHSTTCFVTVMDWLANGCVLVTGCNRVTITFFKYDHGQKQLIALSTVNGRNDTDPNASITGLHVSLDRLSRHVAVTTFSRRACVMIVWRIEDPPELGPALDRDRAVSAAVDVNITMVDRYSRRYDNRLGRACWLIQACAWHPWKHSLICYAVTASDFGSALLVPDGKSSWFVLANACNGEVLKRVEQTSCYSNCSAVRVLSVVTHSMTFSRITGELLVSATTAYRVQKYGNSNATIMKTHSVVVMHALNRIVETLSSSNLAKGFFFAWNPDGTKIALACSDESLRIWNFWPIAVTRRKTSDYHLQQTNTAQPQNTWPRGNEDHDDDNLNVSRQRDKHNNNNYCYQSNNYLPATMSELSLDASRVIK